MDLRLRRAAGVAQVPEADGQWLALLLWAAAAFKCTAREAWIGWHPALAWQRLHLVANNVRFLLLPWVSVPNLASRVLGLSVRRLSADWQHAWTHPILLVETFVDPSRFSGCCYRAAGWVAVGRTRGFARRCGGWSHYGHPQLVLVRELGRGAREALHDPSPRPSLQRGVATMKLRPKEIASLLQVLRETPDPRQRRGVRHSKLSLLAIAVTAVLSGIRSLEGMAQWAQECTQRNRELQLLGCRRHPRTKRRVARIERITTVLATGKTRHEKAAIITSLTPEKASPAALLALVRGHWAIENRSHGVRDVTFDEDRSQLRRGAAPRMMAILRNLAITIIRLLGFRYIPAGLRRFSRRAHLALAVLGM